METNELVKEQVLNKYKKALKTFNSKFIFHMSVIKDEVLKEITPTSIYLIGSFGRNEGSLYLFEETINPFRDYDVLLIVNKYDKRLELPDPYSGGFKFKAFTVWITQITLRDINALPLLKFYELKKASILLWGKDVREYINPSFERLSPYNGILILFSKIEGLLGLLDLQILREKKDLEIISSLVYECMKTYVGIGTCLSLLIKMDEPGFLGKCTKISENFHILFPDLNKMSRTLPSLMSACVYRRLLIENEFINNINLGRFLIETLKDLEIAMWFFIRKSYEVDIGYPLTSPHVFEDYVKKLNTRVLEDLVDTFMKVRLGFCSRFVRELAVRLYLRYTLLKFLVKARKAGNHIRLSMLFMRNGNIMMKLWLVAFTLLSSVNAKFKIDESILSMAASRLCEIVDQNYIERCLAKEKLESRFSCIQKITLDLLDLADMVFHRKD